MKNTTIDRTVTTVIDSERCIGCGACIRVCPSDTLSLVAEKAAATGDRSLGCGHCAAVCPSGAVQVAALDPKALVFATLTPPPGWLPYGAFSAAELTRLMMSRRSCRNYLDRPVPRNLLEDLAKIGTTAPSGTNSQCWTFTVLSSREAVADLAAGIGRFFERMNRLAARRWLRTLMRWLGRGELEVYYREYFQSVQTALDEYRRMGRDRLFHGASALILVGSRPGGSCPAEDALLASQNILLAAHAMGLGTCLVGFAVSALERDPSLKACCGIPRGERVHAAIALGYPGETYLNPAGRKPAVVRFRDR